MAHRLGFILLLMMIVLTVPAASAQQPPTAQPELSYVWQNTVYLADENGQPLVSTGPEFTYGQGARMVWTANGQTLYIARDDGLYATGGNGGAASKLPGYYGRTLTISQDGSMLYYLETTSPQEAGQGLVSYPFREMPVLALDNGTGRLDGYYGQFQAGSSQADLTFAAALYSRDGGLLGPGRPNMFPSYGANIFGTCCFPNPGLGMFHTATGSFTIYDSSFIPGAASLNSTRTHIAGPTTNGTIRVIDLITAGTRDYTLDIGGYDGIERIVWSPDDTMLYIVTRHPPTTPLEVTGTAPFPVDTRSGNITIYRLNLVTSVIRELAWREDVYGVSSLAATDRYVFAVVVDSNAALVNAINAGSIPAGILSNDPSLAQYMPHTHLWRVDIEGNIDEDVMDDVWGVIARPIR